jgi:hypothetical protein
MNLRKDRCAVHPPLCKSSDILVRGSVDHNTPMLPENTSAAPFIRQEMRLAIITVRGKKLRREITGYAAPLDLFLSKFSSLFLP